MADEEKIQKQMEFIIEQQAQFAANMQKAGKRRAEIEGHGSQLEVLVSRMAVATTANSSY
jgi:hypothetical protein